MRNFMKFCYNFQVMLQQKYHLKFPFDSRWTQTEYCNDKVSKFADKSYYFSTKTNPLMGDNI